MCAPCLVCLATLWLIEIVVSLVALAVGGVLLLINAKFKASFPGVGPVVPPDGAFGVESVAVVRVPLGAWLVVAGVVGLAVAYFFRRLRPVEDEERMCGAASEVRERSALLAGQGARYGAGVLGYKQTPSPVCDSRL